MTDGWGRMTLPRRGRSLIPLLKTVNGATVGGGGTEGSVGELSGSRSLMGSALICGCFPRRDFISVM